MRWAEILKAKLPGKDGGSDVSENPQEIASLNLTCWHLKMDGWNTSVLLGHGLFSGANC